MERQLGDLAAASVTVSDPEATTSPDRWTVVVSAGGEPVSAYPPGAEHAAPEIVVADARTPLGVALGSPAFQAVSMDTAVVCLDGDEVVGVCAGPELIDMIMLGPLRSSGDLGLPGRIRIPQLTCICKFADHGTLCGTALSVPEKPATMPPCPNAAGLAQHAFVW